MIARGIALAVSVAGFGWFLTLGPGDRTATFIGLVICIPPAVLTYRLAVQVCRLRPELGPVVLMAGSAVRMAWAVGAVFLVADRTAGWGTDPTSVANYTTVAYLFTLTVETAALVGRLSEPRAADARPTGG